MELDFDLDQSPPSKKNPMETHPLGLQGLFVLDPEVSSDAHGRYSYYYSERDFARAGAASHYVQEHASRSL